MLVLLRKKNYFTNNFQSHEDICDHQENEALILNQRIDKEVYPVLFTP